MQSSTKTNRESSVSLNNINNSFEGSRVGSFDIEEIRIEVETRKQRYSQRDKEFDEILSKDMQILTQQADKKDGLETLPSLPTPRFNNESNSSAGVWDCCKKYCAIT
jgi:hypothetical protein